MDVSRDSSHDLADYLVSGDIRSAVQSGFYTGAIRTPPSDTFDGSHTGNGYCRTLRGEQEPGIHGLNQIKPNTSPAEHEAVRLGTLHGLRCAEVSRRCSSLSIPCICVTPQQREAQPSVLKLTAWIDVRRQFGVHDGTVDQCAFAAV